MGIYEEQMCCYIMGETPEMWFKRSGLYNLIINATYLNQLKCYFGSNYSGVNPVDLYLSSAILKITSWVSSGIEGVFFSNIGGTNWKTVVSDLRKDILTQFKGENPKKVDAFITFWIATYSLHKAVENGLIKIRVED